MTHATPVSSQPPDVAAATHADLDAAYAIEAAEMAPDVFPRFFFTQALSLFGDGFQVARIGETVVGYAFLGRHVDGDDAELYSLVVSADWRGRGAGESLTTACMDVARAWGCAGVRLSVDPNNAPARRLYARVGFEETGFETGYYGPGEDRVLMIHEPTASAYALQGVLLTDLLIILGIVTAALIGLGVMLLITTIRPIRSLQEKVQQLREGELDIDLSTEREDEFRDVQDGIAALRDDLVDQQRDANTYSDVMNTAASGDFTARMDTNSKSRDMRTIATSFNGMMDNVEDTIVTVQDFGDDVAALSEQVAASADEVSQASQEVSQSVQQIAEGAGEQTDQLLDVSQQMNDMSAAVEEIASSADELSNLARETADNGRAGKEAASSALDGMENIRAETDNTIQEVEALDEQMEQIGEIVEIITDIAEQTNILALNANIEAARAGEAGEGFAVVSHEVKSLAEKTKESAEQIAQLIRAVQTQRQNVVEGIERMDERVTEGSTSVKEALTSLDGIVDQIELTSAGVAEIDTASSSQASAAQEVLGTTDEVAGISEETSAEAQNVSAAAQQQSSALTEVTTSVRELSRNASELQRLLSAFTVRGRGSGSELESTPEADLAAPTASPTAPVAAPDGGHDRD